MLVLVLGAVVAGDGQGKPIFGESTQYYNHFTSLDHRSWRMEWRRAIPTTDYLHAH